MYVAKMTAQYQAACPVLSASPMHSTGDRIQNGTSR